MEASDVLEVTNALQRAGIDFWLDGGWGIDALLGAQHRPHDDLDIAVRLDKIDEVYDVLATVGYRVSEDHLPTRAVLRDEDGRQVDLHPLSFDAAGNGWQERAMPNGDDCEYPAHDFTTGRVGAATLGCLSAERQLAHHIGYEPRPHDRDDVARLAERFGLDLPPAYALLRERERAVEQTEALGRSLDDLITSASEVATDDEHDPEGHTIAFERQQIAALLDDARSRLLDVDAALARLDAGTYGRCAVCGGAIHRERLSARPATSTCIACAATDSDSRSGRG